MEQGLQVRRIGLPAHSRRNPVLPAWTRSQGPDMTSLVARASAFGTRLFRIGSPYVSGEALARHIKRNRVGPVRPPRAMQRRFHVSSRLYRGREVFTIGPKPISKPGRRRNDHLSQPGQVSNGGGGECFPR